MKLSLRFYSWALVFGLALTPAVSLADYQSADMALEHLENVVTLSPEQERQALQIFQNLKDIMDDMTPAERPQKGAQSRQDAIAAIRSILTPEQQAIYDRTPQRLGGGSHVSDPAMSALQAKINRFARNFARTSAEIAGQVGTVEKVVQVGSSIATTEADGLKSDDPLLHPDSGTNTVKVTGSLGTKVFKIFWEMDQAGEMSVAKIESKDI
jgi:hypothetical protein